MPEILITIQVPDHSDCRINAISRSLQENLPVAVKRFAETSHKQWLDFLDSIGDTNDRGDLSNKGP